MTAVTQTPSSQAIRQPVYGTPVQCVKGDSDLRRSAEQFGLLALALDDLRATHQKVFRLDFGAQCTKDGVHYVARIFTPASVKPFELDAGSPAQLACDVREFVEAL